MTLLELRDQINRELIRNPEKANLQMYYSNDYWIESLSIGFRHGIYYLYKADKRSKYDTDYEHLIEVKDTDDAFWENPNIEIIEECLIC